MSVNQLYEVISVENPYRSQNDRPAYVYGHKGPGAHGYYGFTLWPSAYFDTKEEALRAIPLMEAAYAQGRADKLHEVRGVLGL